MPDYLRLAIKVIAYSIGIVMLLNIHYANERVFSPGYSNIIILVLANMAIFGSIIYAFTINHPWVRIAILPFVAAILLGSEHAES